MTNEYFKKIVTWKKKPNYFYIFLGLLALFIFVIDIRVFWEASYNYSPIQSLTYALKNVILVCLGIYLTGKGFGEGKEVKWIRQKERKVKRE